MLRQLALRTCIGILISIVATTKASAIVVPDDFVVENSTPGTGFNNPVAVAFTPDGRMLVAEKRGVVRVVVNGVKVLQPMWDSQLEVLNNGDRGLLGIAVDPRYAQNRRIYLLYTVDPDSNGTDTDDDAFARLTSYQTSAADPNVVDPATRRVLIGRSWSDGIASGSPSHGPGAIRFGADGSLLMSCGDGAQFNDADAGGSDPGLFEPGRIDTTQDIGAFRAQYLGSLNGKVLRLNPDTGEGYVSNPYYNGNLASLRSRVWAYGFRNPFRFCVRPGTGSTDPASGNPGAVMIGDVGWSIWEELNVATYGGMNFGWPWFEGAAAQPIYDGVVSPRIARAVIGSPDNPATQSDPTVAVSHGDPSLSVPSGLNANCLIAGVFYGGGTYPSTYNGRMFIGDFGRNWIKVVRFDAGQNLIEVTDFAEDALGPVDFATDPISGDLFYVSIYSGLVNRIRYTGPLVGNSAPVAVAAATPVAGYAPLEVGFTSAGSYDPDADPITMSWNFGDGVASTSPSPMHTFVVPGHYTAVLSVDDGHGGLGRDTVMVEIWSRAGFPSTAVIDDFERPNGAIGTSWVGSTSGLQIQNGEVVQTSTSSYAIWNDTIFPPDQEAFVTFAATTSSAEHDVLLKVQGKSWQDGHVQVHYGTDVGGVIMLTYSRTAGWKRIAGPFAATFGAGDRLGGRAFADGRVEAYKNGVLLGSTTVGDWPFAANGGRIGLLLARATNTRLEDFGGGHIVIPNDTPPTATIDTPLDLSFFAAGDTVHLRGWGADAEDSTSQLVARWEVDLMHNNHVHPSSFISESAVDSFIAENHDDGTGVWLRARFLVTDRAGLSDTSIVRLYPEVDLQPSGVYTNPTWPGTLQPTLYRFTLYNNGRMPAPVSRWRLMAGTTVLAEGDTLLPAGGRATIQRVIASTLPAGNYDLRVVVDTLGTVVETDESNNSETGTLTVVEGAGVLAVGDAPAVLSLSEAYPNPAHAGVGLELALPHAAPVEFSIFDIQGRQVWSAPPRDYAAGRWHLRWNIERSGGRRVRPGIYLARVRIGAETLTRRLVTID